MQIVKVAEAKPATLGRPVRNRILQTRHQTAAGRAALQLHRGLLDQVAWGLSPVHRQVCLPWPKRPLTVFRERLCPAWLLRS